MRPFSQPASLWALWLISRSACLALITLDAERPAVTDVALYHWWATAVWNEGTLPGRDYAWEYPPGSLPVLLLPGLLPDFSSYLIGMFIQMLAFDALVFAVVIHVGRRNRQLHGVWLWLAVPALLGPMVYARVDLVPTALAVLGLSLALRRPTAAGIALGAAVLVKLWPVVVLAVLFCVLPRPRRLMLSAGLTVTTGMLLALATGVASSLSTSLDTQRERGLQIEAVAALPWLWSNALGGDVSFVIRHFAVDLGSRTASDLAAFLTLLTGSVVLVVLIALRRQHRAVPADGAALCVGLLIVGNKVFSPQYLLWFLGILALALCTKGRHTKGLVALGTSIALLTHVVFPLNYKNLQDGALAPLVALTARDLLLVLMVWLLASRALLQRDVPVAHSPDAGGASLQATVR